MVNKADKNVARLRRHRRVRGKISGTAARPRLDVFRSAKHIYAQVIDDEQGMTLADVVKTTVFLADMNDFAEMNKVYGEYFAQPFPARSAVQVAKLPKGAPLEIECIAVK